MLGAIIGDIAGSRYEFNPTNDYHFEMFSKEAGYTDDTICTCAVADALLNENKVDMEDRVQIGLRILDKIRCENSVL